MGRLGFRSFVVSGSSMSPALRDGDRFIGWRTNNKKPPRRGTVVAFPHPRRSGFWLVKRVVGLGEERINIETGEVLVDGQPGLDEWGRGWSAPDGEWAVPLGMLFVLSDQRSLTRDDSRNFGPIRASNMYRLLFPPHSYKRLGPPPTRPPDQHPF